MSSHSHTSRRSARFPFAWALNKYFSHVYSILFLWVRFATRIFNQSRFNIFSSPLMNTSRVYLLWHCSPYTFPECVCLWTVNGKYKWSRENDKRKIIILLFSFFWKDWLNLIESSWFFFAFSKKKLCKSQAIGLKKNGKLLQRPIVFSLRASRCWKATSNKH